MPNLNISKIDQILDRRIQEIFLDKKLEELSEYEKRFLIFEHVCNNGKYNNSLLEAIKNGTARRNLYAELYAAINEEAAICNGLSGYYKLLLDKIGIYSVCICCNDGTDVPHQLNLVKNSDGTYSFDDVTSVIVGRGKISDFFDYDIEDANRLGQGTEQIKDRSEYWIIMSLIYLLVEKDMKPYLEYGVESEDGYSSELPPISSQNKKNNKKNSLI